MEKSKFNALEALKNSFIFYYKNFFNILIIYLPFFIPNLILSLFFKVNYKNLLSLNIYILEYLLLLLLISIIIYPFEKITIYLYFYNKNIKEAYKESSKYYFGILFIYIIFLLISSSLIILSLILSLIFSFPIFILTENFSLVFYSIIFLFIIFSIISLIITNKFFLSPLIYIFRRKIVFRSLKESWKIINIKNATKIFLIQLIFYSIAIIILILQQILNIHLYLKILYVFISTFFLIPIGGIFSLYIYQQYQDK
ncbi:MAG: hypothetical protein ACP5GJ_04175 [Nanopusillaceae archaeon]